MIGDSQCNGGVRLSGGKSLVDSKLVTLHFANSGPSENERAALYSRLSEISVMRK